MKARVANYSHVNQAVKACQVQHEKSSWSDLPFSSALFRKNLARMIRTDGMDILIVQDDKDKITGVLLATVDQMVFSKTIYASDIHFMCDSGGIQLLAEFKRWSREHGAKMIVMGIGNTDPEARIARFYALSGMTQRGDAWVMPLDNLQEKAA